MNLKKILLKLGPCQYQYPGNLNSSHMGHEVLQENDCMTGQVEVQVELYSSVLLPHQRTTLLGQVLPLLDLCIY